ncbi:MAG: asparagine synthase (glutamine-hydrolyzing) [Myxococcales bacterium]|nr:asparagine synthase (glutamine-hydrolyzing) [Myxococcota bacterium]MDW8280167.1 asparagine synthase (glutamine-hydrolyzing) [Myxococcales bacterium]
MCGIGGYVGDGAGIDEQALLGRLAHRGPDYQATQRMTAADGTTVFFAFARLSILDLSPAGHQPMSTEDGAVTLVYNGETYNFTSLREELVSRGHRFRSSSDTEVVLRGYREWGEGVIDRMRGMFAFALWDAEAQCLLLVRDRLGVKPLYWTWNGRRLAFASELRALLASGAAEARLDPRGIHGYLALGSVPQPGTLLRGAALLMPGRVLRLAVGRGTPGPPQQRRYFTLPPPPTAPRQLQQAVPEVAPVLEEAVRLRLVADVPVGILLSGGVDSTAVSVLARRAAQSLATFTLSYGPGERESEGEEARRVAALLGTVHREQRESAASVLRRVPAFLAAADQPSVDGFNIYLVVEQVRQAGLKVALSGLGGDEVFFGYRLPGVFAAAYRVGARLPPLSWKAAARLLCAVRSGPIRLQKAATLLCASAAEPSRRARGIYAVLRGLLPVPELALLCAPEAGLASIDPAEHVVCDPPVEVEALAPEDLVSYLEVDNYLANTLLRDADAMSMAHGVELRVPLCDHVLVSRVLALGAAARQARGRQKPLLVDACGSDLVRAAAMRSKRGFVLPIASFLRRDLREQVEPVLLDPAASQAVGLVPSAVARLWRACLQGRSGAAWRVWALFNLLSWTRMHRLSL